MFLRIAGWLLTTELRAFYVGGSDAVVTTELLRTLVLTFRYVGWIVLWATVYRLTLGVIQVAAS